MKKEMKHSFKSVSGFPNPPTPACRGSSACEVYLFQILIQMLWETFLKVKQGEKKRKKVKSFSPRCFPNVSPLFPPFRFFPQFSPLFPLFPLFNSFFPFFPFPVPGSRSFWLLDYKTLKGAGVSKF